MTWQNRSGRNGGNRSYRKPSMKTELTGRVVEGLRQAEINFVALRMMHALKLPVALSFTGEFTE